VELIPVQRKEFKGIAVQVTAENAKEVAEWCGGTADVNDGGAWFVRVSTGYGHSARTMLAFTGNYIVLANTKFSVYRPGAFKGSFDLRKKDVTDKRPEVLELIEQAMGENSWNMTASGNVVEARIIADKIMKIFGED
jgi:hypothetical protein